MDYTHSTTTKTVRKSGKRLALDERGANTGTSLRWILALHHSPTGWMLAHSDPLCV